MKKIIYIANAKLPGMSAHSIQIMKMCEALAHLNLDVRLIVPKRQLKKEQQKIENVFKYYGVSPRFSISRIFNIHWPILEKILSSRIWFWLQESSFSFMSLLKLLKQRREADVVYFFRDRGTYFLFGLLRSLFKGSFIFEAHSFPEKRTNFWLSLIGKSNLIVTLTDQIKKLFMSGKKISTHLIVAHDAVDLSLFKGPLSKEDAREKLVWPRDQKIILYTGHFFATKGVKTLALASAFLSSDSWIYFVGGTDADTLEFERWIETRSLKRIRFIPYQEPTKIPLYLWAADCLVLPNSSKTTFSVSYTSPLKLFEYMASNRPIVASRLPSLQEILTDRKNALLFKPDTPEDLASCIQAILKNQSLGDQLAQNAIQEVNLYTWKKRANTIVQVLGSPGG